MSALHCSECGGLVDGLFGYGALGVVVCDACAGKFERYAFRIVDVCHDLHMWATQSFTLDPNEVSTRLCWLKTRLANWITNRSEPTYDTIVKLLAQEAVREAESFQAELRGAK